MNYTLGSIDKATRTIGILRNGTEIERVVLSQAVNRLGFLRYLAAQKEVAIYQTVSAYQKQRPEGTRSK